MYLLVYFFPQWQRNCSFVTSMVINSKQVEWGYFKDPAYTHTCSTFVYFLPYKFHYCFHSMNVPFSSCHHSWCWYDPHPTFKSSPDTAWYAFQLYIYIYIFFFIRLAIDLYRWLSKLRCLLTFTEVSGRTAQITIRWSNLGRGYPTYFLKELAAVFEKFPSWPILRQKQEAEIIMYHIQYTINQLTGLL